MTDSKITWHIYEDGEYFSDNEYYLGSFVPNNEIKIIVQVWNNKYGQEDVDNIENAKLIMYFDSIEDSMLLNYCYISINNTTPEKIELISNEQNIPLRAFKFIGDLKGNKNNGKEDDFPQNFKELTIYFKNLPLNLKKDLKNLYLDIESNK